MITRLRRRRRNLPRARRYAVLRAMHMGMESREDIARTADIPWDKFTDTLLDLALEGVVYPDGYGRLTRWKLSA